jgi:small subunit ribosomal protein S19
MASVHKKIKKVLTLKDKKRKNVFIKIWDRSLLIAKEMVGLKFKVHQGSKFINLEVSEEMIGFRFGEFAPTRVRHEYKKKRITTKK